jgi:outer membrane protein OmpA-like peptidoglycan-associated protein
MSGGVCLALVAGGAAGHAQKLIPGSTIQQQIGLTPDAISAATRGIRPAGPATATPAATSAAPAKELSIDLTVRFATGSAELTPQAIAQLNELGGALKSAPSSFRFRIEGHTDTTGTPEANKMLSQRRADAVVAYLTSKFAISAAQLQAVGRGQEKLLVTTPDQTNEPANRRVTVVNLGA